MGNNVIKRCEDCDDPFEPIPGYEERTRYCTENCRARAARRRKQEERNELEMKLFRIERVLERAQFIAGSEPYGPATAWEYIRKELLSG